MCIYFVVVLNKFTFSGEGKSSHIPSPNIQYKELDKSVDWQELLQPRGRLKSEGSASASAKGWWGSHDADDSKIFT